MVRNHVGASLPLKLSSLRVCPDDAKVGTIVCQAFFVPAVLHGLRNHINVVEGAGQLGTMVKFTWLSFFFFDVSLPLGKIAVSSFLLSVFGPACTSSSSGRSGLLVKVLTKTPSSAATLHNIFHRRHQHAH